MEKPKPTALTLGDKGTLGLQMFMQMTDGAGAAQGATGTMSAPGWCHMYHPPPSVLQSPNIPPLLKGGGLI